MADTHTEITPSGNFYWNYGLIYFYLIKLLDRGTTNVSNNPTNDNKYCQYVKYTKWITTAKGIALTFYVKNDFLHKK